MARLSRGGLPEKKSNRKRPSRRRRPFVCRKSVRENRRNELESGFVRAKPGIHGLSSPIAEIARGHVVRCVHQLPVQDGFIQVHASHPFSRIRDRPAFWQPGFTDARGPKNKNQENI